jgi:hypothetical protein
MDLGSSRTIIEPTERSQGNMGLIKDSLLSPNTPAGYNTIKRVYLENKHTMLYKDDRCNPPK